MKCTPQEVHELTQQIHNGSHEAAVQLCHCFMPEIVAMSPRQIRNDVVQEVCLTLILEATAQKSHRG